jgi:predicted Zn-dependent protease with MMP-like domain
MPMRRRGSQARRHPDRRHATTPPRSDRFERLVERALDALPNEFQRLLENVAVVIEDEPLDEDYDERGNPVALYGLYQGTPIVEYGADLVPFPNKISLFRLPLEEDFPDPRDLEDEVRRTVIHELAHHAGFSDRRLEELGYD